MVIALLGVITNAISMVADTDVVIFREPALRAGSAMQDSIAEIPLPLSLA